LVVNNSEALSFGPDKPVPQSAGSQPSTQPPATPSPQPSSGAKPPLNTAYVWFGPWSVLAIYNNNGKLEGGVASTQVNLDNGVNFGSFPYDTFNNSGGPGGVSGGPGGVSGGPGGVSGGPGGVSGGPGGVSGGPGGVSGGPGGVSGGLGGVTPHNNNQGNGLFPGKSSASGFPPRPNQQPTPGTFSPPGSSTYPLKKLPPNVTPGYFVQPFKPNTPNKVNPGRRHP
jgi:hypothetical protein